MQESEKQSDQQAFLAQVDEVQLKVRNLLEAKNRRYGNSALEPVRIFSKADRVEQINVRIDDKLKRIANSPDDEDEDVLLDLMGYLVLKRIARKGFKNDKQGSK